MFKKITAVYPLEDLQLLVWFEEGEAKSYDIKPLIKKWEAFAALEDTKLFNTVHVDAGGYGISWTDEIDLACNELYANGNSIDIQTREKERIVYEVVSLRKESGFTQAQLEEAAGVRQPVIARLEKGNTSPQLDTLIKILAPMGKTLAVVDLESVQPLSALHPEKV